MPDEKLLITFDTMYRYGQLSKHYYAGTERIASRLAGPAAAFAEPEDLEGAHVESLPALQRMDIRMPLHGWGIGFDDPSFANDTLPEDNCSLYPPGSEEYKQCLCDQEADCPNVIYWYHPDHLGSSTFLTDVAGEPYQFVMYLPFGETFAEQRAAGFGTPYLFNAKELDEETGLYYYGARYYDPRISTWWGVDPMAEDLTAWSPFIYTFNNPVRYVDPTGMVAEDSGTDPDPPGHQLPTIFVTAPRIMPEGPTAGILNAIKSIPEITQTFATNVGSILHVGFQKEERKPDFGAQLHKTKGGTQWGLSVGQGGETRYSPNANVGPNLDQFIPAASIVKASINPLNAPLFMFQYGVDAVDVGMSLKSAHSNSRNGSGARSQTPMLEIRRVFYGNHSPSPVNGEIDTVIDGHRILSNGIYDSIAPLLFERVNYGNRVSPGKPNASKRPIN